MQGKKQYSELDVEQWTGFKLGKEYIYSVCNITLLYIIQYTTLTYSFPNLEAVCCPISSSNCCFLPCIQISQDAGQVVWYSHLFQNFPQFVVIRTVKDFGVVNKADVFLELSCFFDDPVDDGRLISSSSAFCKSSSNIWKFIVHVLLKPGLESFEHYFASV